MAVRIYRNNDATQVLFTGVQIPAIPCNTHTAEIVDADFIRIYDNTSPTQARIINKLLWSEIQDEDGNAAGTDAATTLVYVNRQLNTNLATSVYNAGRIDGLFMSIEDNGDTLRVTAGKCLAQVGDKLEEVILSDDFVYPVSSVATNGQDKIFTVNVHGNENVVISEIAGALNGAAIPQDVRTECFLGIVFFNDFQGKFTFAQTMSVTAKNVGSSLYDLSQVLNPKIVPTDRPIISKSVNSDMRLGIGSGRIFQFGSNLITGSDTNPNLYTHPANTDITYLQIAEPNGAGLWQINQLGQLQTVASDNLWTKYDDKSGTLQDTPADNWVLMPVTMSCGQIQQGPILALPTVYVSQHIIPDEIFRMNLESEAVNALQTYEFPNLTLETSAIVGVIAMRQDATSLADTDKVYIFSGDAAYLQGQGLTRAFTALSNVPIYDIYVKEGADNNTATGAISAPYDNIQDAVNAVVDGGSIFIDGTITKATTTTLPNKSVKLYGSSDAIVKFASFDATNGNLFTFSGDSTKTVEFHDINFQNAGAWAIDINQAARVEVRDCEFYHNGWNVTEDKTTYLTNYTQTSSDLTTYYTDTTKVNDGGAIKIANTRSVETSANRIFYNHKSLYFENCGLLSGSVFYSREQLALNLRGAIITSCENVTGYNVAYKANACNGLTVTEGINNRFALSVFDGNWGSDVILDSVSNTKLRDNDLTNSNRSEYISNGTAGLPGAIHLKGSNVSNDRQFIVEVLDTQIHSTQVVANADTSGIYFASTLGDIAAGQNLINLDDIGFIGFNNHIDMGDCDATDLSITIGDNRSQGNEVSYIIPPLVGDFYSLPYSNHVTKVQFIDFSLDGSATSIIVKDSQTNLVINSYPVNTIHVDATTMNLMFDGKIQLKNMDRANISANGIMLNLGTDVATANTLNSMFERTELGGGDVDPPAPTLQGEVEEVVSGTNYNGTYMTLGLPDGDGNQTLISNQTGDNRGDVWSQIPMDQLGEFTQFQTDSAGGGKRFYVGFSRADQLASLGDGSGSGHEGLQWSLAIYDGYDAPWTFYGDQASYSYSSFFTDKEAFRLHSGIRTNKVTWKVGIDANDGRFYVYFWSIIDLEWKYVAKTSYGLVDGDYHAVVRFYTQGAGLYGDFTNYRFPETDPVLTWYYIESPDGSFYYPLFQTEEEANFVDTAEGGSGSSHTHTFVDDQTGTTWYMPDSLQYHDEASAPPVDLGTYTGITWNEQATDTDSNYAPTPFSAQTITVNEGDAVNLQIEPAGAPYATTIGGIPAWTYNNGFLQGTAPEVTGDNVTNPSDTTTVTVYRTNSYGTSQGTLTIVINNLDAPVTPITGFTLAGGTALVDSDTMDDGSVVSIDDQVNDGNRFVFEKEWLDNYVLPSITSGSGTKAVWIGFANASANWSSISGADFDLAYQFICDDSTRANNNFVMKVYNQGATPHSVNIGSLTSGLYDYVFINDGTELKLGSLIESQGHNAFSKVYDTSNTDWKFTSGVTGLTAGAKSVYIATQGTTLDLSTAHFGEGTEPAASTNLTSWNKALDFSGSNQHAKQVSSNTNYMPIGMDGLSATASGHATAGYTSGNIYSRPWACTVVFRADGNSSNQHIWNQGEGAGSTDDNIYLRLSASRQLFFGWGRDGALNELYIGTITANRWYGIYVGHTGERLSGANATGVNLSKCFDVRLMSDVDGFSASSDQGTAAEWNNTGFSTIGGRMDRSVIGDFTIGGRGANRNFHGKIASMVVTTLRINQPMPTVAEAELMITDPIKWLQDYKIGNTYRVASSQAEATFVAYSYLSNSAFATQVWLMGDGSLDNYSNMIRNVVYPQDQNYTRMQLNSMVSNDIETVNINGLT